MKKSDVVSFAKELRPHIEAAIDSAEVLKGMAAAAREKGIDWPELKKLVKAQVQDARDGTDKRVAAIIEKADFAASYADMLGFASNMNNIGKSCSSENAPETAPKPIERPAPIIAAPVVMPDIPAAFRRGAA